jgi:methionine sulfoxide reductase heme-binding subunit
MTVAAGSAFTSAPLWYLTRISAIVGFVLLTLSFALGLASTRRALNSTAWPRFATQELHRNLSLLAVGFIALHVITTLSDTYVHVGWWSLVVPFVSGYRRLWVGLGTLAFDAVLVVIVTSLFRDRLPHSVWRAIHWTVYVAWPLAFLHFLKTGTDSAPGRWGLYLDLASLVLLGLASATRWLIKDSPERASHPSVRDVARHGAR